ncbi:MAG: hypothetical protein ACREEB_07925 [Caulobacteraceae bacterium]
MSKDKQQERTTTERHGHTVNLTIKGVCKRCNNGWMSGMESAAKPHLEPLLLGRRTTLGATAIEALAHWVVLKIMVHESIEPRECVFTREDTLRFAQDRYVPEGVYVWLFKTKELEPRAYCSRAFMNVSNVIGMLREKANVQTTVFVVGRLVIFFYCDRSKAQIAITEPSQFRAKRLWPPRGPHVLWPPIKPVDESYVAEIALGMRRFVQSRGLIV